MESKKLQKRSELLKKEAETVLEETKIIRALSKVGRVEIIGSLRLDLLYRRDIDIFVYSKVVEKRKANDLVKDLLNMNVFQTIALADMQTWPELDYPKGFYFEVIYVKNNNKWKFDIWYLRPVEEYAKLVESSLKNFDKLLKNNQERRNVILAIKDHYFNGIKYKDNIKSIDIYKAVLNHGVKSVEEFTKFIEKNI